MRVPFSKYIIIVNNYVGMWVQIFYIKLIIERLFKSLITI
jgi:hypothetical protein